MSNKIITVYDIAKEAGVSPSTVSRVLNGSAPVREDTEKKVRKIIKKYNFKPNALARSLYKKKSNMLGFILPDITSPFFASIFLEAEKRALELGYTALLCNSMNNEELESQYLKILVEKQVDGIVFMGGRINDTHTNQKYADEMNEIVQRIPVVMVNGRMTGVDCYRVRTNERKGIVELVNYLVELGHRNIGLIGGIPGITSTDIKVKAFKQQLKRHNLNFNDEWVIHGGFSIDSGVESMEALLNKQQLPSAVMCINDFVAIGAIKKAKAKGYKVPEDISVTGFDNIYLSEVFTPGITTVVQTGLGLGTKAVDIILKVINEEKVKKDSVIETSLVVRGSCKKL